MRAATAARARAPAAAPTSGAHGPGHRVGLGDRQRQQQQQHGDHGHADQVVAALVAAARGAPVVDQPGGQQAQRRAVGAQRPRTGRWTRRRGPRSSCTAAAVPAAPAARNTRIGANQPKRRSSSVPNTPTATRRGELVGQAVVHERGGGVAPRLVVQGHDDPADLGEGQAAGQRQRHGQRQADQQRRWPPAGCRARCPRSRRAQPRELGHRAGGAPWAARRRPARRARAWAPACARAGRSTGTRSRTG